MVGTIDSAKKWEEYFYDANREYNILRVIDEKEIKSKLYDGVTYGARNLRNAKKKYGREALEEYWIGFWVRPVLGQCLKIGSSSFGSIS